MDMGTLFTKIAPYLAHPLTLVGFVLLLSFGIHRLLVTSKIIQPLNPSEGSKVVHTLLRYGFVIALVVILLGFGLQFWQSKGNSASSVNGREEGLVKEFGITQAALKSFFKILEQNPVPPEDLDSTLREYAKRFKDLQAQLARLSLDDSVVLALKDQAQDGT